LDTHTLWIQQAVRLKRVDLRKVPGESNPADLLTKHSLSRDRLEMLVELFGCKFIGGRAESAPLQRTGASEKVTMASASQEMNAVAETAEQPPPVLPHVTLEPDELDKQYPPMSAPPHDELDDIMEDADDPVLQTGLRLAEDIRQCKRLQGRLRRFKEDVNEQNEPNTENVVNMCTEETTDNKPTTTTTTTSTTTSPGRLRAPPNGGSGNGASSRSTTTTTTTTTLTTSIAAASCKTAFDGRPTPPTTTPAPAPWRRRTRHRE
jgi:hypothetical protein